MDLNNFRDKTVIVSSKDKISSKENNGQATPEHPQSSRKKALEPPKTAHNGTEEQSECCAEQVSEHDAPYLERPVKKPVFLPPCACLSLYRSRAYILDPQGELHDMDFKQASAFLYQKPVILCHAPYTARRLKLKDFYPFDLLELFAFAYPGRFCVPTPAGLLKALGLYPSVYASQNTAIRTATGKEPDEQEKTGLETGAATGPETGEKSSQAQLYDCQEERSRAGEDLVMGLYEGMRKMLADLQEASTEILPLIKIMDNGGKGWNWAPYVLQTVSPDMEKDTHKKVNGDQPDSRDSIVDTSHAGGLNVWHDLPEWAEEAPLPRPAHFPVEKEETLARLQKLLDIRHSLPQARTQQQDYAVRIARIFDPVDQEEDIKVTLAEAGTGVGKTLGYLAPASVWAEKNGGTVWVSTYTKSLQRQIEAELEALYPDPALRKAYISVRKGRENYLCLLNYQEACASASFSRWKKAPAALGIMARWIKATGDGDLSGRDFPAWLTSLLGMRYTLGLADRRGECIYGACQHYHRCFVEKSVRQAKRARIVIANHALVMISAALGERMQEGLGRYIFDEGHHLFQAADSAFATHLTVRELADLRRWLAGPESGAGSGGADWVEGHHLSGNGRMNAYSVKSRMKGLKRRITDLVSGDDKAEGLLRRIDAAASLLPDERVLLHFQDQQNRYQENKRQPVRSEDRRTEKERRPTGSGVDKYGSAENGPGESSRYGEEGFQRSLLQNDYYGEGGQGGTHINKDVRGRQAVLIFFELVFQQVWSRNRVRDGNADVLYSHETGLFPLVPEMQKLSIEMQRMLQDLLTPLADLASFFRRRLEEDEGDLSGDDRKRYESVAGMIERRTALLMAWIDIVASIQGVTSPHDSEFIDWIEIRRQEGRILDVGIYRHYRDPMHVFARTLKSQTAGLAVTSATLRDSAAGKQKRAVPVSKGNEEIKQGHKIARPTAAPAKLESQSGESRPEGTLLKEEDAVEWKMAIQQTGATYFTAAPDYFTEKSPFDYGRVSKVIVIDDVSKTRGRQVAGAFFSLFQASGGGALGIFTAVRRLQQIYPDLREKLEQAGIPLYGQHMDVLDSGTLVDIFREEDNACLLGTDAMRDGVDIPGHSLRLVVFDRIPWPRPTILHKARRELYGGRVYDDFQTRLKLKQAYGRLIRKETDRGVFVLLDSGFPSRLHSAFPEGVDIEKLSLQEACAAIRRFV